VFGLGLAAYQPAPCEIDADHRVRGLPQQYKSPLKSTFLRFEGHVSSGIVRVFDRMKPRIDSGKRRTGRTNVKSGCGTCKYALPTQNDKDNEKALTIY